MRLSVTAVFMHATLAVTGQGHQPVDGERLVTDTAGSIRA